MGRRVRADSGASDCTKINYDATRDEKKRKKHVAQRFRIHAQPQHRDTGREDKNGATTMTTLLFALPFVTLS